jgi:hypothetical protein
MLLGEIQGTNPLPGNAAGPIGLYTPKVYFFPLGVSMFGTKSALKIDSQIGRNLLQTSDVHLSMARIAPGSVQGQNRFCLN